MTTQQIVNKNCKYCEGNGVSYQQNGPDDVDLLQCECVKYSAKEHRYHEKGMNTVYFEAPTRMEAINRVLTEIYF